jgi:hypothetical protein
MLRLISYLAPSIPAEFFELLARTIREGSGMDVGLAFEDRIFGPAAALDYEVEPTLP